MFSRCRSGRLSRVGFGAAVVLLVACAAAAQPTHSQTGDSQLDRLNDGYSLLYGDVSGLANADKIFLVKFENDATQKVVTETADTMGKLTGQLERVARDYPSIRLDLKPLPEIERETQAAAATARIKSFAPVVGRSGADFERTLLLTLSGGLNQLRHLARVMAEAERSDERSALLRGAENRLDALYAEIEHVLEDHYFAPASSS